MFVSRPLARFGRACGGATALEFAIAMPLLLAMMIGIFQFGWAQHCASSMRAALEQGARALTLNPSMSASAVQTLVQSRLATNADPNVQVALAIDTDPDGYRVARLTGTYQTSLGVPTWGAFPINFQTVVTTPLPAT